MKVVEIDQVRLIQPSLATLVSSRFEDVDTLLTVGWVMPVSYYPSKVAVSISPERFSHDIIKKSGMFAINIMEYDYVDNVCCAGTVSGREFRDKFRYCGLNKEEGYLPLPIVKEALGVLECKVSKSIITGDHEVFIGDVRYAYVKDKYSRYWDPDNYHPILYISEGHFITLNNELIKKFNIE